MRLQFAIIIAIVGVVSAFNQPIIQHSAFLWGGEQPLLAAPAITPLPVPNALYKRITSTAIDPLAICGYDSGNASLPVTCDGDSECGFDPSLKAFGCCDRYYVGRDGYSTLTDCDMATKCYDSTAFSSCGAACQAITLNDTASTSAKEPYCVTLVKSGYVSFGCDSVKSTVTVSNSALNAATTVAAAPTTRAAVASSGVTAVASSIKPSSTATLVLQSSASSVVPLNAATSSTGASIVPFSKTQASATDASTTGTARPSNVVVIGAGHLVRPVSVFTAIVGIVVLFTA